MEVVCLILGPMLASQPCSHAFWVLTSLHLLSFLLKMFTISIDCRVVDTVTDTTSCGIAHNAVSEIEYIHHL